MAVNAAEMPGLDAHSRSAFQFAQREAIKAGATEILGVENLLIGLILEPDGAAGKVLRGLGLTASAVRLVVDAIADVPETQPALPHNPNFQLANSLQDTLNDATRVAVLTGAESVTTKHLLTAMLDINDSVLNQVMAACKLDPQVIVQGLGITAGNQPSTPETITTTDIDNQIDSSTDPAPEAVLIKPLGPTLLKYTVNLTEMAKSGKLDPVIGREFEISRIIEILFRRTKANPILTGPAGTGKTAIVEGVVQELLQSHDPQMHAMQVLALDLPRIQAGTTLRGALEERVKRLLKEVEDNPQVVIFLDELHIILGTGSGGPDVADILKPALARGKFRCIGATTNEDYRRLIKDGALARRFQPVSIDPPSRQNTIEILMGLRQLYQEHHHVVIPNDSLEAAVDWSGRYTRHRAWPDSAIDLMEDGAAVLNTELQKQRRDAQKQGTTLEATSNVVERRHLARAIAAQTGIPQEDIANVSGQDLFQVETKLHERIIGQDQAISEVARALRRSRAGLRDPDRPVASFLFLGPTGVGKTEVARRLAEYLFHDPDALVRLDMSEFSEPHSIARLLGAPPGYVGHDEGGALTEAIRRRPYSVVLFDEIEKGHQQVSQVLLQLLDAGQLTDSAGRKVDASHIVFIATSNVGHGQNSAKSIGFVPQDQQQTKDDAWRKAAENYFPLELINRFDALIPFHSLSLEQCLSIAQLYVDDICQMFSKEHGAQVSVDTDGLRQLVSGAISEKYGAREIRRAIVTAIQNPLAEFALQHELDPDDTVTCDPAATEPVHLAREVASVGF